MQPTIKKSQYRLRVCNMPDGTVELVFGDSALPDGAVVTVDQDVTETITTTPHVEPV